MDKKFHWVLLAAAVGYDDVVLEISTLSSCTIGMNGNILFHGQNQIGSLLQLSSRKILFLSGLYQGIVFLLLISLFTEAAE